ncbi:MAG: bis-aminopropyl spermidine synthase family protein [Ornithinimicrobium sp.]
MPEIDLRAALNAVSDVIQNRPRPLREFDQIHMKAGDMVLQSELVARWAENRRLAFIGDGDGISVCVAYMAARGILSYEPEEIVVFDFDERVVQAVNRFADREGIKSLRAELYNCVYPLPEQRHFDCYYTNPPWGASNDGASVNLFSLRGMESISFDGEGMIVIADDDELDWPKVVLAKAQSFAAANGFFVERMTPGLHSYHLDDNPDLLSCNLLIRSLPGNFRPPQSQEQKDKELLHNFYGRGLEPRVKYVRELKRLDYGKAHEDEYRLELLEDSDE